jgi:hypothetical protein
MAKRRSKLAQNWLELHGRYRQVMPAAQALPNARGVIWLGFGSNLPRIFGSKLA